MNATRPYVYGKVAADPLLGLIPDAELAADLRVSKTTVNDARRAAGLPPMGIAHNRARRDGEVLAVIRVEDGATRKRIADRLGLCIQVVAHSLTRLLADGLITREVGRTPSGQRLDTWRPA